MKFLLPVAAVMSMAAAPAMAAPQIQRSTVSIEDSSELGGGAGAAGFVIGLLALAAIIAGIAIAAGSGGDSPNSP